MSIETTFVTVGSFRIVPSIEERSLRMSKLRARLSAVALTVLALAATPIASSAAGSGGGGRHGTCGRAALLFCEDFERQPPGGASSLAWGVDTRHGTLRVEHGRHGGKV